MKRAEVWVMAGGPDYAGKPRPVVILQADAYAETDSVTVCPFTSVEFSDVRFRVPIAPSSANGLRVNSQLMADKLATVSRHRLRGPLGALTETEMSRLGEAVITFLALVGSQAAAR